MTNWQQVEQLTSTTVDLPRFSDALQHLTAQLRSEIAGLDADHISLRYHQNTTVERWRHGLEQRGTLPSENMANGRPICLFKLAELVRVAYWRFHIIELLWSGEKYHPREGQEHIEIVLLSDPAALSVRALALLADGGLSQPGIIVKTSSSKEQHERLPSPTLTVTNGNVMIKLRPWSTEQVVTSEQADT